jgi:biotin/methionine sulfoxide reductase
LKAARSNSRWTERSSSSFAQGCTGQLTTVEAERFNGNLPPIRAFDPA